MFFASPTALLFAACGVALSQQTFTITTTQDLIDFSNNVNSGTSYYGTTVYLGSDIDFSSLSEQFQPIGFTTTSYFNGTFDGQGHVISNLTITTPSSSEYTGLFGYSGGATIRNVVIDASCAVVSSSVSTDSYTYAGGIIGSCRTVDSGCLIENSVNMGSISFGGDVESSNLRLGGIVGDLRYSSADSMTIRNCANYGAINKFGTSEYAWIGGIVGIASEAGQYKYIQNCANYGQITHSGSTTGTLGIGGIVGFTNYVKIDNCLSIGPIYPYNTPQKAMQGGVVGWVDSDTYIEYCYFTSDTRLDDLYGINGPYTPMNTTGSSSSPVAINSTLLNNLNTQASKNSTWSKWLLNIYNGKVTFKVNDYKEFSLQNKLILLPDLAATGSNTFKGWFTDTMYLTLTSYMSYANLKTLYGLYGVVVTITFDCNGGYSFQETKSVLYGETYGTLPVAERIGHSFAGWFTASSGGTEIVSNTTVTATGSQNLYAHWTINNYTITFETNGGESIAPITSQYLSVVDIPKKATGKEGYEFKEWVDRYGNTLLDNYTVPGYDSVLQAVWTLRIRDASKLVKFSNEVNRGTSRFLGTVYLESDIDFTSSLSQQFEPIGFTETGYFNGVFDGQGHTISNLTITTPSSSEYTGLFGYSNDVIIRNVVMDASCSVLSSSVSTYDYTYVGGIIGSCYTVGDECMVENSVNMGSISFGGDVESSNLRLGGIAGEFRCHYVFIFLTIRNCVNYGAIEKTGTSDYAWIGGIVGLFSEYSCYKYIQNCANYGPISHSGSTSGRLGLGGIAGFTDYAKVENCLSAGKISSFNYPSDNHQGGVVGYVDTETYLEYCHFTSDVELDDLYAPSSPYTPMNTTGSSSSPVSLDSTLLNNLNTQTSKNSTWNKWLINTNNSTIHFKVNDYEGFNTSSQLIILPDLAATGSNTFKGWFTDPGYSTPLTSYEVSEGMTLYGLYGEVVAIVRFDGNGGTPSQQSKSVLLNKAYGALPEATRTGYTFAGWFTEKEEGKGEEVTEESIVGIAKDHTLYAQWAINNYTITFIFDNGKENEVRTLNFNETIVYPENPTREGFIFNGWSPKPERMPAEDITVTAQWIEVTPELVEIVFDKKDLTEEEVKEIIEKYTKEDFVIERFETDNETGEIKVIIKFKDSSKAAEFARNINEYKRPEDSFIRSASVVSNHGSLAITCFPLLLNLILM